jgi:uncharacterized membrane protein
MVLNAIGILLAILTVAVLFLGVYSMVSGGPEDRHQSNRMMLARVEVQALALALFALAAYLIKL